MSAPILDEYGLLDVPEAADPRRASPQLSAIEDDPWLRLVEDAADIIEEKLPPIVEVVQGIVAEQSKLLIGSGSKSFKTWLTMDISISIAHGLSVLGRETTRTRVLYVNLELKPQTFKRRLQTIAKAKGITIDREWFRHLPLRGEIAGMPLSEIVFRIIRLAKHMKAPRGLRLKKASSHHQNPCVPEQSRLKCGFTAPQP